jgi:diacylglycerol kinase
MYRHDEPASHAFDSPNLLAIGGMPLDDFRPPVSPGQGPDESRPAIDEETGSSDAFAPPRERFVRAGRRNLHEKLVAGLVGIKHAIRGDSSFFAHAYRALLVFLTAGMIGVSPIGWFLLILALGLVLIAELMHSAVDTLARAIGDPDEPRLKVARDVAASGVLVSVFISAAVSIAVLTLKLGEYLGWWDRVGW